MVAGRATAWHELQTMVWVFWRWRWHVEEFVLVMDYIESNSIGTEGHHFAFRLSGLPTDVGKHWNVVSLHLFFLPYFFFQTQGPISPHCIVPLPNSNGMQLLLCYDNEGVYVNTYGKVSTKPPEDYFRNLCPLKVKWVAHSLWFVLMAI
jgi:hypothetical protein